MNNDFKNTSFIEDSIIDRNDSEIIQFDYSLNENYVLYNRVDHDFNSENFFGAKLFPRDCISKIEHCYKNYAQFPINDQILNFRIDWIHNLIYRWDHNNIHASDINRLRYSYKVLFTNSTITCFIVNPFESFLFWGEFRLNSERKPISRIMRANQDGSEIEVIFGDGIDHVTNLAIDHESKLLFWVENYVNITIKSIDFEGEKYKLIKIFHTNNFLSKYIHYFEYLNDRIYLFTSESRTDMSSGIIFKIFLKYGKTETFKICSVDSFRIGTKFMIIDLSKQPERKNQFNASNCSNLCLPINSTSCRNVKPELNLHVRN